MSLSGKRKVQTTTQNLHQIGHRKKAKFVSTVIDLVISQENVGNPNVVVTQGREVQDVGEVGLTLEIVTTDRGHLQNELKEVVMKEEISAIVHLEADEKEIEMTGTIIGCVVSK